ncbi:MAG: LON peptidase substrate-binding domain-containing protein [Chloroflexota bacterium]
MPEEPHTPTAPIFPLNTVLFPKMPLALQIFEERYKAMLADIRDTDSRFIVALIREGQEVGGPAEPYTVACLAEITHLQPLPDDKFFLVAIGLSRVRILSIDATDKPYLVGTYEPLPEEMGDISPTTVDRASNLFLQYAQYLMDATGEHTDNMILPADPDLLSCVIATALQIGSAERQRLLEKSSTQQRLQAELDLLLFELPLMRALVNAPKPPDMGDGRFSSN